jgi:anti-sigma regulatory factor (Ser/Thr protein kinase)
MSVDRQFGSDRTSAAAGRQFVCDATADLPSEIREQIALMVSELATNSLVHAVTGFEIRIDRSDARIRVEVTDLGGGQPTLRSPGSHEPHGRGLQIVKALSDSWGSSQMSERVGKTVWFELGIDPGGRSGSAGTGRPTKAPPAVGESERVQHRGPIHRFAPLRSASRGRRRMSPAAPSPSWCRLGRSASVSVFVDCHEVRLEERR